MLNSTQKEEFVQIDKILKNDFKDKKILITGANGLIGSYLVDYLITTKATVFALSRSKDKLEERFQKAQNLHFIECNLNNGFKSDIAFDYIIHAASNAHPLAYSKDPVGTMKTNLIGTSELLEHIVNYGGKFLYLSTGEVYGNAASEPFKENDFGIINPTDVRSCYPESKRAAETLCVSYASQFNISVNIARLCYVYGPTITTSNSRADAQFLRNAIDGKDIILKSKGEQKRTYCYVADAACALLYVLLYGKDKEAYNIANPNSIVSIADYAQFLAKIANVKLKFEIPAEIEAKGYSKQGDSILNASKLIELGWQPLYDIEKGLKNTFYIKTSDYTNY